VSLPDSTITLLDQAGHFLAPASTQQWRRRLEHEDHLQFRVVECPSQHSLITIGSSTAASSSVPTITSKPSLSRLHRQEGPDAVAAAVTSSPIVSSNDPLQRSRPLSWNLARRCHPSSQAKTTLATGSTPAWYAGHRAVPGGSRLTSLPAYVMGTCHRLAQTPRWSYQGPCHLRD